MLTIYYRLLMSEFLEIIHFIVNDMAINIFFNIMILLRQVLSLCFSLLKRVGIELTHKYATTSLSRQEMETKKTSRPFLRYLILYFSILHVCAT